MTISQLIKQTRLKPNNPNCYTQLGQAYLTAKDYDNAAGTFAKALEIDPKRACDWQGMAQALENLNQRPAALQSYEKALGFDPDCIEAYAGVIRLLMGSSSQSILWKRIQSASPQIKQSPTYTHAGLVAHLNVGDSNWAIDRFEAFPHHFKDQRKCMTALIRSAVYNEKIAGPQLLSLAKKFAEWHCPKQNNPRKTHKDPNSAIRIGFVCSTVFSHNVGSQLRSLLKHGTKSHPDIEFYLYASNHGKEDQITEECRKLAKTYRDIKKLSDEQAASQIKSDQIDVLVDLHEFTNNGRLTLFSHHPSPVQVHYLANSLSTGLPEMTHRISTRAIDPPELVEKESSEQVAYVTGSYHFYDPDRGEANLTTRTPALDNGYPTFGAIHHHAKYTPEVLRCYASIMKELPTARLILARLGFAEPDMLKRWQEILTQAGIPLDRTELRDDEGKINTLEIWKDIDCMLDSFPFSGSATTLDALYAGVPVITLKGDRIASRTSASLLLALDAPELIAENPAEYVQKAVALGGDIKSLSEYRNTLTQRLINSPNFRHEEVAKRIIQALVDCRQPSERLD